MGFFAFKRSDLNAGELPERLQHCEEKQELLALTIRALFLYLKQFALDIPEIDSQGFKNRIDDLDNRFISIERPADLKNLFERRKRQIPLYIDRQQTYIRDREVELRDIITLLSKAIAALDTENRDYHQKIYVQGEKFESITLLDDIKKIKTSLRAEIDALKQTVKEKQTSDQVRLRKLARRVNSLNQELEKAKSETLKDGLTGLYNRRAFDAYLRELLENGSKNSVPFCMLLIDIDDFKRVNDQYGHPVGDRALMAVAGNCQALIRKEDFLARYGGEEFVALLPGTDLPQACQRAESIRHTIATTTYDLDDIKKGQRLSLSLSIGVSQRRPTDSSITLTGRADQALYAAKRSGKNRVVAENEIGGP